MTFATCRVFARPPMTPELWLGRITASSLANFLWLSGRDWFDCSWKLAGRRSVVQRPCTVTSRGHYWVWRSYWRSISLSFQATGGRPVPSQGSARTASLSSNPPTPTPWQNYCIVARFHQFIGRHLRWKSLERHRHTWVGEDHWKERKEKRRMAKSASRTWP